MYTITAYRMKSSGTFEPWITKEVFSPAHAFEAMEQFHGIAVSNRYHGTVLARGGGEAICRRDYGYSGPMEHTP